MRILFLLWVISVVGCGVRTVAADRVNLISVRAGMTAEQVLDEVGAPDRSELAGNRGAEQWSYFAVTTGYVVWFDASIVVRVCHGNRAGIGLTSNTVCIPAGEDVHPD